MSRSRLKRLTEEDRFARRFACWANNHGGWSKTKKRNRRIAKRKLKREDGYELRDKYGDLNDSQPYEEAMTMEIEALEAVQKHEETYEFCGDCDDKEDKDVRVSQD